jgi:UDP-N-acetylmuramyl pentapeptide phosphotransferase/UDP-N-acetylglucosamine-1-phosphate transferase
MSDEFAALLLVVLASLFITYWVIRLAVRHALRDHARERAN